MIDQAGMAREARGLIVQNLGLCLGRSPRFLLQDVSFELKAHEATALLGNSGSGQTSLLQLLAGLRTASQGRIVWHGQEQSTVAPMEWRRQITWLPHQPRLLGMNVGEAIAYPLRLQGLNSSEIQQRLDTWLGILALPLTWLELPSQTLSPNAAQGVALARALAMEPQLLLLDNPWPQPLEDFCPAAKQSAPAAAPWMDGSPQSLPAWEAPQAHIEQALARLMEGGGSLLWSVRQEIAMAQRLLSLNQGRLQRDEPATATAWKHAMGELQACHPEAPSSSFNGDDEGDWD